MKQKKAVCRRCGREIWLIECTDNNKWMSCDLELRRFTPAGGPGTFIGEDGKLYRGANGGVNGGTMWGYRKHRKDCVGGGEQ